MAVKGPRRAAGLRAFGAGRIVAAVILLVLAGLGAALLQLAGAKLDQHLRFQVQPDGQIGQGPELPSSQGVRAAEGLEGGGVLMLNRMHKGGYWLQRFDAVLAPTGSRPLAEKDWLDLAVLPGGESLVAARDGWIVRHSPALKPLQEAASGLRELGGLEASLDGRLLAIDRGRNEVVELDPRTLQAGRSVWALPAGRGVKGATVLRLAVTASGRVAVFLSRGQRLWLGVTAADGFAWLRALPMTPAECQFLAAAGETLLINDCSGGLGVAAWNAADGRFVGHGINLGGGELVISSGFVSADRRDGRIFFHHTGGLRLGSMP